ncbi:MAG: ferredoxin--NADP reductase [bacterium]|nr:ferredoxin--NADP reductase [bacterium]
MGNLTVTVPEGMSKDALRSEHYNATVTKFLEVHDALVIFQVKADFPLPAYKPGQYVSLGLGWWEDRSEGCGKDKLMVLGDRIAGLKDDEQEATAEEKEKLANEYETLVQKLIKRSYSICHPVLEEDGDFADPLKDNSLEFYITIIRGWDDGDTAPLLTPRFALLGEGDRIFMQPKITGFYTLDGVPKESDLIFGATGTGEAPHNPMIAWLLQNGHEGQIVSIVCARYLEDLAYVDVHHSLEERFENYHYVILTTRDLPPGKPKVYVQDYLKNGSLEELLGKPIDPSMHFFLCGNPDMVGAPKRVKGKMVYPENEGVIEILETGYPDFTSERKAPGCNIHFEEYW